MDCENEYLNRFKGSLIGLAVGDAYGTTFEFLPRESIKSIAIKLDDFMGLGVFNLMPGMFTDDTSLALIQSESLLDFYSTNEIMNKVEINYNFVMNLNQTNENFAKIDENTTCLRGHDIIFKSLEWYQNGHFSASGSCFDIGKTTRKYLFKNNEKKREFCSIDELNDNASGNGALMRLAPVPLYFYGLYLKYGYNEAVYLHKIIEESGFSAMTTHPSQISIDCNRYFAALLIGCLQNATKEELLSPLFVPKGLPSNYWSLFPLRNEVKMIVNESTFKTDDTEKIKNSGFSVKALESALWGFYKYDNFMDGLFEIVKLGDDSDTIGAIYGQLAGCFYGLDKIPLNFVNNCVFSKLIQLIAEELLNAPIKKGDNSWAYIQTMKIFELLENEYYKINEKKNLLLKRFKTLNEFDEYVKNLENKFKDLQTKILESEINIENTELERFKKVSNSLLNDFIKRCNDHDRNEIKLFIEKNSMHNLILSQIKNKN